VVGAENVAVSPDGRLLAFSGLPSEVVLDSWPSAPTAPSSPTGGEEGDVTVWDVRRREVLRPGYGHEWPVQAVTYSPDGRWMASAGYDARVEIRDARTGCARLRPVRATGSGRR
jgi:WD40 repeat protein